MKLRCSLSKSSIRYWREPLTTFFNISAQSVSTNVEDADRVFARFGTLSLEASRRRNSRPSFEHGLLRPVTLHQTENEIP